MNNFDKVLSCVEGLTDHYHTNSNETIISNHRYIDILTKRTITTFSLPVKLLKTSNDETEEDSTSNGGHSFVGVMGIDVLSFGSDLLTLGRLVKATIHQAMLLQAICGYFDLQATLLPRIETCSILGNTLLTTSK